ncbi:MULTISPECIES: ATP-binding protein [Sphingobacterium]|uniref:AAA ATPase domain-containing protein n=1 Tax=Sphingobacterium multivorum TaxID=28454 RepID=A0A653ZSF7_SPHMU|nr:MULTISPECIES: ATP-binding protein [Sphingobacterium]VXC57872.1 AAA ATPase domain-containing protein [Sphingobacterium multivorum]
MKLKTISLKNFRGYYPLTTVEIDDLTVLVGKNDIGKSTILEALDIFFNEGKGIIKIDKDDINKTGLAEENTEIIISATFCELPADVILDATSRTSLTEEFLLNSHGDLEVIKRYTNGTKQNVFIKALHPRHEKCSDLLSKKNAELKTIVKANEIHCENLAVNSSLRKAIWSFFSENLQTEEIEIDVTKGDTKSIWDQLQTFLPQYSLFQSDRKNSDGDSEVQDPLKEAVRHILGDGEIIDALNQVAVKVEEHLNVVVDNTLTKLREMNPDVANSLTPIIPPKESLKWIDVFKNLSIFGDYDIPINKRGSGVKRLVLLNFFRAEAERKLKSGNLNSRSIIYAIEEPETSQHSHHQKLLINAFTELSTAENTQVLLTTHGSNIVKGLSFNNLRLVSLEEGNKIISEVSSSCLPYPSLNEVNYIAFGEITEEYHNELYGFLELQGELPGYFSGKPTRLYVRENKNGTTKDEQKTLSEYIRHQIHHPENVRNPRYTFAELKDSIEGMSNYIQSIII